MTELPPTNPTTPKPDETSQPTRDRPSLLAANLYLLLGIGALLLFSGRTQNTALHYLIGVGVEILLAAGAVLFIRLEKLPVKETLRLRWPDPKLLLLSALLGLGLWAVGVGLNLAATLAFGYTTPVPPKIFPGNILEGLALLLATVVAAPLCEEVMFRGYVQRAYARRSPWIGVLMGGFIFALYHLRFQGVFALMPVALALGFVAWRGHSLLPGIVMHAAYNSVSSIIMLATSFLPMEVVGALMLAVICVSFLAVPLSLVALWYTWRSTDPPEHRRAPRPTGLRRWLWPVPLVLLALLYGYAAITEVIVGRFPEMLAEESLALSAPAAWDGPRRWTYTLQAGLNQTVGEATCALEPLGERVALTCEISQSAFENELPLPEDMPIDLANLPLPGVAWEGPARELQLEATWAREGLALQTLDATRRVATRTLTAAMPADAARELTTRHSDGAAARSPVPEGALVAGEWPWRLSGLPFDLAYGGQTTLIRFDDAGNARSHAAHVTVRGGEPSWAPAGTFVTWRVTLTYEAANGEKAQQTAWYDADPPHALVRYEDGTVRYLLEMVE